MLLVMARLELRNRTQGIHPNVYAIIQCALWRKGYSTRSNITTHFYGGTGSAIKKMKTDIALLGIWVKKMLGGAPRVIILYKKTAMKFNHARLRRHVAPPESANPN